MKRSLAALLFVALPTFASDLAVHFDLSDSVRAALQRGQIKAVRIGVASHSVEMTGDTTIVRDVEPGKTTIRAFIITDKSNYVVDPKGVDVVVAPDARTEVTVPVHSQFITGTISLRGKPLHAHQMSIMPSDANPGNWGFAVPFDEEGRFAFPLPCAGDWDLQLWWNREVWASIPRFTFKAGQSEVHIAVPEGMISGRVVDKDGNGIAGVRVRAMQTNARGAGTLSGDDGAFTLDGLVGGTWTLTASGEAPLQVAVPQSARKDGVVLHLPSSYKYSTKDITAPSKP